MLLVIPLQLPTFPEAHKKENDNFRCWFLAQMSKDRETRSESEGWFTGESPELVKKLGPIKERPTLLT